MKIRRVISLAAAFAMLGGNSALAAAKSSAPAVEAAMQRLANEFTDFKLPVPENWTVDVSDLPSKLDLRDRGVVPPVRNQDPWGTCWGFGSIAASEIAILSDLGLTCEQFKEKYGYDLDLSERHLAWFGTYHMPESAEENPEMDAQDLSQAGEGLHTIDEKSNPNEAHYNLGGLTSMSASVFAAGFGPVLESDVPYTANDGSLSETADWSVAEDTRFITAFDLLDSSILPNPAVSDHKTDTYTYNEAATNAIKRELANGHAVAISYHGDVSTPDELNKSGKEKSAPKLSVPRKASDADDSDELYEELEEYGFSKSEAKTVISFLENGSVKGMSDDDKYLVAEACIYLYSDESDMEELLNELEDGSFEPDEILEEMLEDSDEDSGDDSGSDDEDSGSGEDTDSGEEAEVQYIDYKTYAQYTYDATAEINHCVCIIGYDDDYAVTNFQEGHQPPKPGAWIVRNSWDSDWGNGGYFYLSYYDKTISDPQSFVFDVSDIDKRTETLDIPNYNLMQIEGLTALMPDTESGQACVYKIDEAEVLTNVSLFTAVQDTDAVVSVYLLNADAKSPVDGKLLDSQTLHYDYAGFHRVKLTGNYLIPANSSVSVVAAQTCRDAGKTVSVLPVAMNTSYEGVKADCEGDLTASDYWYVAKVNAGESYVLDGGNWVDWKTVIDEAAAADNTLGYFVFDNPSLKLFLYPFNEMQEIHHLDTVTTDANGSSVSVCDEDGYTVIR